MSHTTRVIGLLTLCAMVVTAIARPAESAPLQLCVRADKQDPTSPKPNKKIVLRTDCTDKEVSIGQSDSIWQIFDNTTAIANHTLQITSLSQQLGTVASEMPLVAQHSADGGVNLVGEKVLASTTVSPPTNGYILAFGTVSIYQNGNNSPFVACSLSLDNHLGTGLSYTSANGERWTSVAVQRLYNVTPGALVTINLVCANWVDGNVQPSLASDPALAAMWFANYNQP